MNTFKSYFLAKDDRGEAPTSSSTSFSGNHESHGIELNASPLALSTVGSMIGIEQYPSEMKKEVLVRFLYQEQCRHGFNSGGPDEGVILKKSKGQFTSYPEELQIVDGGLFEIAMQMNHQVCSLRLTCVLMLSIIKVVATASSNFITSFLWGRNRSLNSVPIGADLRIQILPTLKDLPKAQKHQCAAFIADTSTLVLWDDEPTNIFVRAQTIQSQLVKLILNDDDGMNEKTPHLSIISLAQTPGLPPSAFSQTGSDMEANLVVPERPTILINAWLVGLTLMLLIMALSTGWRKLAIEVATDKGFIRLALLAVTPVLPFLSLVCFTSANNLHKLIPKSSSSKVLLEVWHK
jgi:hypothetical protein